MLHWWQSSPPPWLSPASRTSSVGSESEKNKEREPLVSGSFKLNPTGSVLINRTRQGWKEARVVIWQVHLTCSTPSMCASISWITLASRSASSAERRPLLIFSAKCLMSLWASSSNEWSGWSSEVCFSKSCSSQRKHVRPVPRHRDQSRTKKMKASPWPAARIEGSSGPVWSSDHPEPASPCSHACFAVKEYK